jgi:hypothetical protein
MTLNEISNIRLTSQKIESTKFKKANEIVSWMGAIQAQDFSMAKLALGVRLLDSTEEKIVESLNKGEIIRTHLMRPTWHFVTAEDIYWMLELTAPQIKTSLKSRHTQLELSESIFAKSNSVIEKSLRGGVTLSREELAEGISKAGINTDANRLSHLFLRAELDGILCNGPIIDNKLTFSLLRERVPYRKNLSREESLGELANRYFRSHSPASIQDFSWWSGLSHKDAMNAMESVRQNFITEIIGSRIYLFPNALHHSGNERDSVQLLPAYDEFLISYRDRSPSLSLTDNKKAVSVNGIFNPVVVINGQVNGLWRRSIRNEKVILELILFNQEANTKKELFEETAAKIGRFYNRVTEIIYSNYNSLKS